MTKFLLFVPASAFIASKADEEARRLQAEANCTQLSTEGTHWNPGPWSFIGCGQTDVVRVVQCAHEIEQVCEEPKPLEQSYCDELGNNEPSCSEMPLCGTWELLEASNCDECGTGESTDVYHCPSENCREEDRPVAQTCMRTACTPTWTEWSECTAVGDECGVGKGLMTRNCVSGCDEDEQTQSCFAPCAGEWYVEWSGNCYQSRTVEDQLCGWGQEEGTYKCPEDVEGNPGDCGVQPTEMTIQRDCWEDEFQTCPMTNDCMIQAKWRKSNKVPQDKIEQWINWHTMMQGLSESEQTNQLESLQLPEWVATDIAFELHESSDQYDSQFKGNLNGDKDFLNPEECMQLCLMQYTYGNAMGWDESELCQSVANPNINNLVKSGSCWMRNLPIQGYSLSDFTSKRDKSIDTGCLLDMMANDQDFNNLFGQLMATPNLDITFTA